jgi:hypothetical protein
VADPSAPSAHGRKEQGSWYSLVCGLVDQSEQEGMHLKACGHLGVQGAVGKVEAVVEWAQTLGTQVVERAVHQRRR